MSEYEERIMDLEESKEIQEKQLVVLTKDSSGDEALVAKSLQLAEDNVVLIRKRSYLENEIKRLTGQVSNLQNDLAEARTACLKKINDLSQKNKTLSNTVDIFSNQLKFAIDPTDYSDLRNRYEELTVKYRDLLKNFGQVGRDKEFQVKMFEEIRKNLQEEKSGIGK
jgi:hypothetical protein